MLSHAALSLTFLLWLPSLAASQPVITNGSMTGTAGADTAPLGWTKANATPDVANETGPGNNTGLDWVLSPDGGTFGKLNGTVDPTFREAIAQTVSGFTPGQSYSLAFYITNMGFYFATLDEWRNQPGFVELHVDGILVGQSGTVPAPATRTTPNQWTSDAIVFVATDMMHTLRFEARTATGATAYLGIDGADLGLAGGSTTTTITPTTSTSSSSTTTTSSSTSSSTLPSTSTSSSTSTSTIVVSSTSSTSVVTTSSSTSTVLVATTSSSTTTVTTPTTTTTSTQPPCLLGGCDDGDACTTDTCNSLVGCVATPLPGLAGVACRLDGLPAAGACSGPEIDAKFATFVRKRVERGLRAVAEAVEATKERKVRRQLRKIARELKKIARRVAKCERKERITPECAATVRALLCRIVSETDVPELQQTPCVF
jgi:hypothetical protein